MIDALISLPIILGGIVFMALTTALGLAAYVVTCLIHSRYGSEETIKELVGASSNLMRVVGWLLCLLLSMTFTKVLGELVVTKTAIVSEAAAILENGIKPENAYHVTKDERGKLRWDTIIDGQPRTWSKDPETSGFKRFKAGAIELLPIQNQL
jgi:hypothetical protein